MPEAFRDNDGLVSICGKTHNTYVLLVTLMSLQGKGKSLVDKVPDYDEDVKESNMRWHVHIKRTAGLAKMILEGTEYGVRWQSRPSLTFTSSTPQARPGEAGPGREIGLGQTREGLHFKMGACREGQHKARLYRAAYGCTMITVLGDNILTPPNLRYFTMLDEILTRSNLRYFTVLDKNPCIAQSPMLYGVHRRASNHIVQQEVHPQELRSNANIRTKIIL
ncbi:hypothetical protein PoB_001625000 [Plakobranchus ocellatus]|uniref:Uncharacterized protein n=1 Tax=Plakobranchus ocellatus TaxID=259542 RepID=A0AAV3Z3K9_9GAST|nr:hypothetical protein PoB_001625000 [Plakobranchus ocellatus]